MASRRAIPLHNNESYWLLSEEMAARYTQLDASDLATYPDYGALRTAFASLYGVAEGDIALTPGSDAAIEALIEMCALKGLRALIPLPTFSAYELLFRRFNLEFTPLYYRERGTTFEFPLEETLAAIGTGDIDIVFLCQPNNPLGSHIPRAQYMRIAAAAREKSVTLVVDEAYAEFAPERDESLVQEGSVILLRTVSKSFGLAGLRVGCAIAPARTVREIATLLLPWPIAHPSVRIALKALADAGSFRERLELYKRERDSFVGELRERRVGHVFDTHANFVLIRVADAKKTAARMAEKGIMVAEGSTKTLDEKARQLLASTVRLSVPSPNDRALVMDALAETTN